VGARPRRDDGHSQSDGERLCAARRADARPSRHPDADVGDAPRQRDLIQAVSAAALESLPAVVFVHGGAFIGGELGTRPDLLGAISRAGIYEAAQPFRLRPDLPPTLILTGETDHMVRLERVTSLAEAIRASGSECELLIAPFAGHGFDGEPNSFGAQLSEALVPDFVFRVAPTSS
jgi:acetyl esterase/lipase